MRFPFFHYIFLGIVFFNLNVGIGYSQKERLEGKFENDSVKIGEEIKFSFSYTHPKDYQVIFPDTNYDFSPFEIIKRQSFATTTTFNSSVDSAVYYLRTFKVTPTLSLSLPIILINEPGDSTIINSIAATVFLQEQVKGNIQNYNLKNDTQIMAVDPRFNYPYFLLFGIGGLISILVIFAIFRKRILRRYKLYMLRNGHVAFLKVYERLEKKLNAEKKISDLELAIGEWKLYLSRLENSPINTYTTTEIVSIFKNEELGISLQDLDRTIYGSNDLENFQKPMNVLKRFCIQRFQRRKKEVRNA